LLLPFIDPNIMKKVAFSDEKLGYSKIKLLNGFDY